MLPSNSSGSFEVHSRGRALYDLAAVPDQPLSQGCDGLRSLLAPHQTASLPRRARALPGASVISPAK